MVSRDQEVELASHAQELGRDRLASDEITEAPSFVDPRRRHGTEHGQQSVMATVHVGANADSHRLPNISVSVADLTPYRGDPTI